MPCDKKHNKKWLIIPIGTKVREFHGSLLLGCVAAESGFEVILGDYGEIINNLAKLPRGIILERTIFEGKAERFKNYKKIGNRIVTVDEEGLVFYNENAYKKRIGKDTLSHVDYFFGWGDEQVRLILEKVPEARDKVLRIGNPRLDILRSECKVMFKNKKDALLKKYGKMILINTNFAVYNSFFGFDYTFNVYKKVKKIKTKADEDYYKERYEFQKKIFQEFYDIFPVLSKRYPEYAIIIRPHPAENHQHLRNIVKKIENVEVVYDNELIPWLMAASVLVHNSCTTAVEAYPLGTPVLAYRPITSDYLEGYLPNSLSTQVFNREELMEMLDKILSRKTYETDHARQQKINIARRYMESLQGPLASERIVSCLKRIIVKDSDSNYRFMWFPYNYIFAFRMRIRKLLRLIIGTGRQKKESQYGKQTSGTIRKSEIIFYHRKLVETMSRFGNLKFRKLFVNSFIISSRQP